MALVQPSASAMRWATAGPGACRAMARDIAQSSESGMMQPSRNGCHRQAGPSAMPIAVSRA
jgi:hypothetical protein